MKAVRWGLLVVTTLSIGAAAGFAFALLRPRAYADFAGVNDGPVDPG